MIKEISYNSIFDSQRHFRTILDAMARPGTIHRIKDQQINPPDDLHRVSAYIGFALLNAEVTFYIDGVRKQIAYYFTINTFSRESLCSEANFLFLTGSSSTDIIDTAKSGNLLYPERGATLVIDIDTVSSVPLVHGHGLTLQGPGVENEISFFIEGISLSLIAAIKEKNEEFPLGVDVILTDRHNDFVCIPRSSKISF